MATPPPSADSRVRRESRLLLITVLVCALVLIVLARLRFPDAPAVDAAPPPFQQLAARASYEALAADMDRAEPLIRPHLVALTVTTGAATTPRTLADALAGPPAGRRPVVAVRIDASSAVGLIERSGDTTASSVTVSAASGGGAAAALRAVDAVRGLATFAVAAVESRLITVRPLATLPLPTYVVAAEPSPTGETLRPVFLGRAARVTSTRWAGEVLPLGGVPVSDGALVFALDGAFVGAVTAEFGAPVLVGARALFDAADRLATAGPTAPPTDPGITVQTLTPAIAEALAVARGVVVTAVEAGSGGSTVEPGDVITAIAGQPIDDPDDLLLRLAERRDPTPVPVTVVRDGVETTAAVAVGLAGAPAGMAMIAERGGGTRIASGPTPAIAGLRPGDVIVRAGTLALPSPARLRERLAADERAGQATLLLVRREGRTFAVAVPPRPAADAAR
ncbi:MAG: PDZ domain-containing protein [Vicinamibacterales bacterium]